MNDRQDPYGPGDLPPEAAGYVYGYDEYGRPVYAEPPQQRVQQAQQTYDPYAAGPGAGATAGPAYDPYPQDTPYGPQGSYDSYVHDPYAAGPGTGPQASVRQDQDYGRDRTYDRAYPQDQGQGYSQGHSQGYGQDYHQGHSQGYGQDYGQGYSQDYGQDYGQDSPATGQQQPAADAWIPQQSRTPGRGTDEEHGEPESSAAPGAAPSAADADYRTEQFSFVEEEDEESEDVIDWMKFSESRTERREEARRRGRNRTVVLVVALVLALVGGVGYLGYAGKLPGLSGPEEEERAAGGGKRKVIVVHLREVGSGETSTALLVNNETAGRGTTVLLPNSLAVSSSGDAGAATTLGKAFDAEGAAATRDALGLLLGTEIKGTWRLDTPYLENWVELVGGITVDADTTVPGSGKDDDPVVREGGQRDLDGRAAVAYATYRASGEEQTRQLARFGQVVRATLARMSGNPETATRTVENLAQIPDPSLSEAQLGASLAPLARYAKGGDYTTELLPVERDGTLSDRTSEGLVKNVLGGTVRNTDPDATPRVSLRDATGGERAATTARVTLVNGGYTVLNGGTAGSALPATTVTYADPKDEEKAREVAKTLGLPEKAVARGKGAANADVTVILGQDYEAEAADGSPGGS